MLSDFTISEKARLVFRLIFLSPWQIAGSVLRTLFIVTRRGGRPVGSYLMAAVMRVALSTMAPRQMQYCSRSTSGEYRHWIDSQRRMAVKSGEVEAEARLKTDIEPLDTEVKANMLWIGDRERAEKVVLFFHGGGYMVPIRKGHLEWCWRAYVAPGLEDGGVETAVAVLQYTVTPGARFPTQLRQAASGLSQILASGFRPQDVIIGGDSAEGT